MIQESLGYNLNVLLVEDNPADARLMYEALPAYPASNFKLSHVERLSDALEVISEDQFDLVLLDLNLPDSTGLETMLKVYEEAPKIPIIIITNTDDEATGIQAVREGTQDYLVKNTVNDSDPYFLKRSMIYAIERHRILLQQQEISLIDELTGLYNRRGFQAMAHHQIKIAARTKTDRGLLFADIDKLKWINDTKGHREGDRCLVDIGNILSDTFRESDIIARLGGDEFVVLFSSAFEKESTINRLEKRIYSYNTKRNMEYDLSLSVGMARYEHENPCTVEQLISQADALMYEHKRSKKHTAHNQP